MAWGVNGVRDGLSWSGIMARYPYARAVSESAQKHYAAERRWRAVSGVSVLTTP